MKCIVCDSKFFYVSFSAPAEDCDCGMNFTREDWQDATGEDLSLDQLRKDWEQQTGRWAPKDQEPKEA